MRVKNKVQYSFALNAIKDATTARNALCLVIDIFVRGKCKLPTLQKSSKMILLDNYIFAGERSNNAPPRPLFSDEQYSPLHKCLENNNNHKCLMACRGVEGSCKQQRSLIPLLDHALVFGLLLLGI